VRTDCADQTCIAGSCIADTVDQLGMLADPPTDSGGSIDQFFVNFYAVSTNRTLREIQQIERVVSSTILTWLVYESTTKNGTYSLIFATTTTPNSYNTLDYQSSGSISVPLVAGKFYAIGIGWGVPRNYQAKGKQIPIPTPSFGTLIGILSGFGTSGTITTRPMTPPTTITSFVGYGTTTAYPWPQTLRTAPR
jgi:hypothetical protein